MEMSDPRHSSAAQPRGKNRGTHSTGGWVSLRAGLGFWRKENSPAGIGIQDIPGGSLLPAFVSHTMD